MAGSTPLTLANSTLPTSPPAKQFSPLPGWIWFIVAALLLVAAPGTAVLWFFGLAAFLVGSISLLRDLNWQSQLITFAVSGIAAVMLWQRLDRSSRDGTDLTDQLLGGRGPYAFVGRVFKLQQPIVDGFGMETIGGILWRVAGNDCAAGKRVRVVRAEGTLLIVDLLET
jgi:membrane protein implicated in regulation of membrane protease activity